MTQNEKAINGLALIFVGVVLMVIGFRFGTGWLGWIGVTIFGGTLAWLIASGSRNNPSRHSVSEAGSTDHDTGEAARD